MVDIDKNAREYAQIAREISVRLGIPARALMAQWALESGWGRSKTGEHNWWGITFVEKHHKGRVWCKTTEHLTERQMQSWPRADEARTMRKVRELQPGVWLVSMYRWFASYADTEEAVLDYTMLLMRGRYDDVRKVAKAKPEDMLAIGQALRAAGYATATDYAQSFAQIANGARVRRALEATA